VDTPQTPRAWAAPPLPCLTVWVKALRRSPHKGPPFRSHCAANIEPVRIIFFGSAEFSIPSMNALLDSGREIVAVVTQPDRPSGRGHVTRSLPVKVAAQARGLRVLQPENVSSQDSVDELRRLDPDVLVVAAYGQILRQALLDVPKRGSLNVHASLLPRHRGASPVAAAILAGDKATGVTVMEMVRALDAGPIVVQASESISDFDTTGTLEPRLAASGARLLAEVLEPWLEHRMVAVDQVESLATYAPQLGSADAVIDWSMPAIDIWQRVRAFNPRPVARTGWHGEQLRILQSWPLSSDANEPPGTVLPPSPLPTEAGDLEETFAVQTGDGSLAIRELQRPGRRPVSGPEFLRGQRDFIGSRLGD
jgi:methionyl-tRNA formyltransferase